jgi:hypothetical protein
MNSPASLRVVQMTLKIQLYVQILKRRVAKKVLRMKRKVLRAASNLQMVKNLLE